MDPSMARSVSDMLGAANLIFWMYAQVPQVLLNHRLGSVDGLSLGLVVQWTLGDVTNLAGCLLTGQLPVQILTAIYFVAMDCVLCGQWLYYSGVSPFGIGSGRFRVPGAEYVRRARGYQDDDDDDGDDDDDYDPAAIIAGGFASDSTRRRKLQSPAADEYPTPYDGNDAALAARTKMFALGAIVLWVLPHLAATATDPSPTSRTLLAVPPASGNPSASVIIAGAILAWASGLFYFFSRIPQILLIVRRKSVHGISLSMFASAVAANVCYGLSILVVTPQFDMHFYRDTLPFIIGSIGTVVFDVAILVCFCVYGRHDAEYEEIQAL